MKYIDADLLRKEIERRNKMLMGEIKPDQPVEKTSIDIDLLREKIVHEVEKWKEKTANHYTIEAEARWSEANYILGILDSLPEQPVTDHHEIEVEFRGEKVTVNREFYRDGEMNYSTSEQDDNAIWSALRAWCEKKGITPFELYPKQSEQPMGGLEEEIKRYLHEEHDRDTTVRDVARHFAEWGAEHLKNKDI